MGDLTGDRYEVLLENVLAENRRLRETIEARDSEQRRLIQELSSKLEEQTASGPGKGNRKRKRKICVSKQCRQDFRKMYNTLKMNETFEGFVLGESISTQANQNVAKIVIDAVVADNGGDERCPWSLAEIKSAAATYFKSLHTASERARRGKQEAHKALCRRQGRMRDKLQKRSSTIELMPWSQSKKTTIYKAMTVQYMSSDESELSEDENGVTQVKGYLVKKLPWERSALTSVKKTLDEAYLKTLHPRLRANILERGLHARPSTRGPPFDPLDWAVRIAAPGTPAPRPPTGRASGTSASVSASSQCMPTPLQRTDRALGISTSMTSTPLQPTGRALGTSATVPASLPSTSTPCRNMPSPDSLPTPNITPESTSPLAVTLPSSTHRPAAISATTPRNADLSDGESVRRATVPLRPVRSSLVVPPTITQNSHRKNTDSTKRGKIAAKRKPCAQ